MKNYNSFENSKFSIIANGGIKNCNPAAEISVTDLAAIYQNKAIKDICSKLSIETDPDKRKEIKLLLPYITPHGTFSYRSNEKIKTYNKNILAIDIDKIQSKDLKKVFNALKNTAGAVIVSVSASGNGIKALFHIEYNNSENLADHYQLLKYNENLITASVGLSQLKLKAKKETETDPDSLVILDTQQFVLSQPFFIFKGNLFYFNTRPPEPLKLDFEPLPPAAIISPFVDVDVSVIDQDTMKGIIMQKLKTVIDSLNSGGARHPQIYKFRDIAKLKKYFESDQVLESEIMVQAWNGICKLYGNERTARSQNAEKSLLAVFKNTAAETDPDIDNLITAAKQQLKSKI